MIINPIIPIWLMLIICIALAICKRKGIYAYIRQIIIIILLFAINLRVMVPQDMEVTTKKINANIFFVVDNTISMVANDAGDGKTRLEVLKEDCKSIAKEFSGAKYSLITFSNIAKLVFPLTESRSFLNTCINGINVTDEIYARGSSMNVCKEMLLEMVKGTREHDDSKILVFFVSDGEITNGDDLESFKEASEYIDGGAVLGYGTESGGRMKVWSYIEEKYVYLEDNTKYPYRTAISKMDEQNLKSIAKDLGIEYINMTENKKSLDKTLNSIIKNLASAGSEEDKLEGYKDLYFIFVIPLLAMLIFEFIVWKRKGEL